MAWPARVCLFHHFSYEFQLTLSSMDMYEALRQNLIERLCDKETSIRAQCVVALARLSGAEDPNELEEGESSILELLTEVLIYDDEKCVLFLIHRNYLTEFCPGKCDELLSSIYPSLAPQSTFFSVVPAT